MIIKSISVRNIRSYTSQKIEFPEGSVLLSGDVGSGKSSILLAIEFALFGLKRGELSGTSLLRHGKKEGWVELRFEIGKKEVIIKRALKRSKTGVQQQSGYIIINGVKSEGTAVELKTKILELFGYPQSFVTKQKDVIFRYTVYTPQEQMKQILFEDRDARLDTLRTVFDIDKYKRIRDNANLFIKEIKNKKSEFSGYIADLEDKKKELKQRKQEVKELDIKLKEATQLLERAKQETEKKKRELEMCMSEEKQYEALKLELEIQDTKLKENVKQAEKNKRGIEQLDKEISELKDKIEQIKIEKVEGEEELIEKAIEKIERELNEAENRKSILKEKLESSKKEIEKSEKEIEEKKKKLDKLKRETAELKEIEKDIEKKSRTEKQIEDKQREIDEVKQKIEQCKIIISNAEKIREEISSNDKCPICLQPLTSEHRHNVEEKELKIISENERVMKELTEKNNRLKKTLEEIKGSLELMRKRETKHEALKVEFEHSRAIEREIDEKNKTLTQLKEQKNKLSEELTELSKLDTEKKKQEIKEKKELMRKLREIDRLKKEKDNLNQLMNDRIKAKQNIASEQDDIKKEVGEINSKKAELAKSLEKFKGIEEKLKKVREEYEAFSKQEKDVEIRKVSIEKEKQGIEKLADALEKDIKTKKEVKEKLNKLNKNQQWLEDFFINLVEVMEKNIMAQLYNEFNELFQNWFRVLIEDENISVRLDDTFTPVIEQNGYETYLENLSGGEKTSCALAYRLALNKVINDFVGNINTKDIIILDEPTDGFSTEQLDKVRDVLDQINIKQVIIVSHETKIESFVDNVVRIVKHEHISSVV